MQSLSLKKRTYLVGKPVNLIWREMCTVLSPDESGSPDIPDLDALMEFIYTLPFPDGTKWRILDLCKHYTDYLDELLALLRPAVLLVGKNRSMFDELLRACARERSPPGSLCGFTWAF